jgi:small subunit ribosomal protein S20
MANTKSAKKRHKQSEKNRQRNQSITSRMRTFLRRADEALTTGEPDSAKEAVRKAVSEVDRACTKGVIHRNSAARKKSSLERRIAALGAPEQA